MTYGPAPATKPPVSGVDAAVSVTALTLTLVAGAVAAFFGVFFMAFTDDCPAGTCNIDAGVTAMFTGFIVAAGLWVAGLVLTVARLRRRTRAWPYASGTLALCTAACVLGIAGYLQAVGG